MHCTTLDIDGEFILDEENVKELYKQYKNSIETKDTETLYVQDNSSSDSDDGILSMEVNPLFLKKYEKLSEFNLLKKENYKKLLRDIKRKKKHDKIIIDLTKYEDEEIIKLKFSKTLNKKMKRPISRIETKEIIVNLIIDETSSKSTQREIIPDFFDKKTSIENLFLSNKNVGNDSSEQNQTVSILSYNILSQRFIKNRKVNDIDFPCRMNTVIEQLKLISSDILCLQEVDSQALNIHLIKNMKNYCFYFQTYGAYFNNVIAFKTEKFVLIGRENLNLKGINIKSNRSVFKVMLEVKTNKTQILVYNLLLPRKPKYIYHKIEILGLIAADVLRSGQKHVIITGDFNSTPDSILLKLLHDKFFVDERIKNIYVRNTNSDNTSKNYTNPNMDSSCSIYTDDDSDNDSYEEDNFNYTREIQDEDQKRKIENNSEMFKHFSCLISQYAFKSAYEDYKSLNFSRNAIDRRKITKFEKNHPEFTFFTENFQNTVDYIFYSKTMELKKILKIPSREQVSTEGHLPSTKFPSDHLIIYAQLELKN